MGYNWVYIKEPVLQILTTILIGSYCNTLPYFSHHKTGMQLYRWARQGYSNREKKPFPVTSSLNNPNINFQKDLSIGKKSLFIRGLLPFKIIASAFTELYFPSQMGMQYLE